MRQLSGVDSAFLTLESWRTPMHVSALMLYQGPIDASNPDNLLSDVQARFEGLLDRYPLFRQRVVRPPLRNDHPYWIDAHDFNIENHVHLRHLPKPGDWRALRELTGKLQEQPLRQELPLWEATVIDGLDATADFPPNSFAIMVKVHHAAVDGASVANILGELHRPDHLMAKATMPWQPEREPTSIQLVAKSYENHAKRRKEFWKTMGEVVPKLSGVAQSRKAASSRRASKQSLTSRFNDTVSASRVFDSVNFPIESLAVCKAAVTGATINDIVVAIIGGGLRKYLDYLGELEGESLITGAPINIRNRAGEAAGGNQLSMMRLPLGTHIADGLERLKMVASGSTRAKTTAKNLGLKTLGDIAQTIEPRLLTLGLRLATSELLSDFVSAPVHTIVSNVPGPKKPMQLGDATMTRVMGLGPLIDQVGLFNTVTRMGGSLSISFVSTKQILPEPEVYSASLQAAYDELVTACEAAVSSSPI